VTELVEIAREHLGEELKTVALKLEAIELAAVLPSDAPFISKPYQPTQVANAIRELVSAA
jgi:hypothetical protein